jgi:hypothetical protein
MADEHGWNPPAKEAAAEERRRQRRVVLQLLKLETEELFSGALRLMGIGEDSPEWEEALRAWREYHHQD